MNNQDKNIEATSEDTINQNLADAETPGQEVEFDPEDAERLAFREDALSDEDARDSVIDLQHGG
jgi:hypothetical protein